MKLKRTAPLAVVTVAMGLLFGGGAAHASEGSLGLEYNALASGAQEVPMAEGELGRANGLVRFDRRLSVV